MTTEVVTELGEVTSMSRVVMALDLDNAGASGDGKWLDSLLDGTVYEPTVVTSLRGNGKHAPVLDIDVPARMVPSSTPGKHHLYIDVEMSWEQYERLLHVLADVGIIERGYLGASKERKFTAVRLPWIKKKAKA